jgi:phage-related protein
MPWAVEPLNAVVEAELLALPEDIQARYLWISQLLEAHGPHHVGMPHVRHLEGRLWEMRLSGRAGIARAIYMHARGQRLVVLHAFVKKSQKTPPRAIQLARARARQLDT